MIDNNTPKFEWEEWNMESANGQSAIEVPGRPVSVSAAFTGRVAIAYQSGTSFQPAKKCLSSGNLWDLGR